MAYQGFGDGIAEDGAVVGQFVAAGLDFFVATSFSKSFSLYGERVGALSVVCAIEGRGRARAEPAQERHPHQLLEPADARRAGRRHGADHARRCARCGKRSSPACACASRRCASRCRPADGRRRCSSDMSFITRQNGMFSYSGLSKAQMQRLRSEFGVYGVDSGRICVAALNDANLDATWPAIAAVA